MLIAEDDDLVPVVGETLQTAAIPKAQRPADME
jgi:hypothetical protein